MMGHGGFKNIAGVRFGDRTAIRYLGAKRWLSVCVCGAEIAVDGADLRRRFYRCQHDESSRFWSKVRRTETCWLWLAAKHRDGYGSFRTSSGTMLAHRWVWLAIHGSVSPGTELDHLCRNRACVNPSHLEAVSHAENVRRGELGRVTAARHAAVRGESTNV